MKIEYKDIILRDMTEADIEDDIRWYTLETDWSNWDAPWEPLPDISNTDSYRKKELLKLAEPKDKIRWGFEIETAEGNHIGTVNSYMINENFEWISVKDIKPGDKAFRTVGISICESSFCGKGFGTKALAAFVNYYLENGEDEIYCQTWSGNIRMVKCAEKLGFEICKRKIDYREVNGKKYDGLTFKLNKEKFYNYLNG
ncbi:MAG: GNAT family N-acetyltransferase [Oscillospiraceae bacterium]|nr:GNAT family N-acetyltransferase [Oscillospiraceae bacterium]